MIFADKVKTCVGVVQTLISRNGRRALQEIAAGKLAEVKHLMTLSVLVAAEHPNGAQRKPTVIEEIIEDAWKGREKATTRMAEAREALFSLLTSGRGIV